MRSWAGHVKVRSCCLWVQFCSVLQLHCCFNSLYTSSISPSFLVGLRLRRTIWDSRFVFVATLQVQRKTLPTSEYASSVCGGLRFIALGGEPNESLCDEQQLILIDQRCFAAGTGTKVAAAWLPLSSLQTGLAPTRRIEKLPV